MQEFNKVDRQILLQTARDTIKYCLDKPFDSMQITLADFSEHLRQERASFVTLHTHHKLRGCIGSLQAHQPLIVDVMQNSYNAAFRDPRFAPLTLSEFTNLHLEISILSKPEPMHFTSEADLLQQLRPSLDGLILSAGGHRGTFLPSVWEQLPDKKDFLQHLKVKAGLATNYWSDTITIERYTTELID